jgi:hypothetical protein
MMASTMASTMATAMATATKWIRQRDRTTDSRRGGRIRVWARSRIISGYSSSGTRRGAKRCFERIRTKSIRKKERRRKLTFISVTGSFSNAGVWDGGGSEREKRDIGGEGGEAGDENGDRRRKGTVRKTRDAYVMKAMNCPSTTTKCIAYGDE